MSRIKSLLVAVTTVAVLGGCTSYKTIWIKSYEGQINPEQDKLLVLPVATHGFSEGVAMTVGIEGALMAGFMATFGAKNAISLQPIKEALKALGLENLTYWMAWGVYDYLNWYGHRYAGDLTQGLRGHLVKALPLIGTLTNNLVNILSKIPNSPVPADYKFRYMVVMDVMNYGKPWYGFGKTRRVRFVGGIVDIQNKRVVGATFMTKNVMANKLGTLAAMGTLAKDVKKRLKALFPAPPAKG
ncbi:MAG: hypothetical protein RBU30_23060 [Polyangia bacterium]|jgi:hypothetical protein|nr:hypothetical protein [Polyangia bacterium]